MSSRTKTRQETLPVPVPVAPMTESPAIQSMERGMMSERMALAREHPRDQIKIAEGLARVVLSSLEIAESCEYLLPNKQAEIRGPSVHLARLLMDHYHNADAGAMVLDIGHEMVTAQGVFIDLERNVRVTTSTVRSIKGSSGNRYSASMIQTTSNAACAIAFRQAVFQGVPQHVWRPAFNAAREMARGRPEDLVVMRERAMRYMLDTLDIPAKIIYKVAGVASVDQIGLSELFELRCRCNAVKDGDATVYEAFPGEEWATKQRPKSSAARPALSPIKEIDAPPLSSLGGGRSVMDDAAAADGLSQEQREFLDSIGD
jgi:hypothetical protein